MQRKRNNMKKLFAFALCLVLLFALVSCKNSEEKQPEHTEEDWSSGVPTDEDDMDLHEVLKIEENVMYGDYEENLMDIVYPKVGTENGGVILFIHGGAWTSGDKTQARELLDDFYDDGYIAASINHRKISETTGYDDLLDDITKALNYIQFTNEKAERAMLVGWSSGGHLAELYGYTRKDATSIKVECVFAYSGISDLSEESMYKNNSFIQTLDTKFSLIVSRAINMTFTENNVSRAKSKLLDYSPISFVSNAVPTVICHAKNDEFVPYSNATALKSALDANGVENQLITFEKSGHDLDKDPEILERSYTAMKDFAAKYLTVPEDVPESSAIQTQAQN